MRPPGLIACAYSWPIAWVRPGKLSRSRARDWCRLPDSNRRIKGFTALCSATELKRHRSGIAAGGLEPYTHDRLPACWLRMGGKRKDQNKMVLSCPAEKPLPCAFRQYHYSTLKTGFGGRVASRRAFVYSIVIRSTARRARRRTQRSSMGSKAAISPHCIPRRYRHRKIA